MSARVREGKGEVGERYLGAEVEALMSGLRNGKGLKR